MLQKNDFRLQPVLNYTASIVDTLELEFARLKLAHNSEVELLNRLELAKNQEMDSLHTQQQGVLDCESILLHQQYLQVLDAQVKRQQDRVKQAEAKVNAKRLELVEHIKNQKTLEKLRDNHAASRQQDQRRREAGAIDDMVNTRYARKE